MDKRVDVQLRGQNKVSNVVGDIRSDIKKINSDVKGINDSFKVVTTTIKTALVAAVGIGIKKLTEFNTGVSNINRQSSIVFGSMTKDVNEWANKYERVTGVMAEEMKMLALSGFRIGQSYGMASDEALILAKNTALIAQDLSAMTGLDAKDMKDALIGAYTGSAGVLEDYGFYIDATTLKQELMARGIDRTVESLSDRERAILSQQLILKQLGDMSGYAAKQMETPAGKLNYIWNQLKNIGNNIITILEPIFNRLLSIIAPIVGLIERLTGKLAGVLGVDKSSVENTNNATSSIVSGMGEVEKATKKASGQLASFDELVTIQKPVDVGVNTNSESLGGLGDFKLEEIKFEDSGWLDKWIEETKEKINSKLGKGITLPFGFSIDRGYEDIKGIINGLLNIGKDTFNYVVKFGVEVANDLQIGAILNELLTTWNKVTNLTSSIVNTIGPAWMAFYNGISPIVKWVGEKIRDGIAFIGELADTINTWVNDNKPLIIEFSTYIGELIGGIWKLLEPLLDAGWEIAKTVIKECLDVILNFATWVMENKELVTIALFAIGGAIAGIKVAGMISYINDLIGALLMMGSLSQVTSYLTAFSPLFNKITGAITPLITGLKTLWATMLANPIGLIVGAIVGIIAAIVLLYNNCEGFRNMVDTLWAKLKEWGAWIADIFVQAFNSAWESIKETWNSFKETISTVVEIIWELLKTFINYYSSIFVGAFTTAKEIILGVWDTMKTSISGYIDGIKTTVGGVIDFITGVFTGDWEKAWNGVKKIFKGVWDSFASIAKAPINIIIDLVNGLIKGMNKFKIEIPDWIRDIPGMGWVGSSFGFKIPTIPKLATGGVVDSTTIAMIGEAGKEAVLPLEHNTGWMSDLAYILSQQLRQSDSGGKGDVHIHVNADNFITNESAMRELARHLKGYIDDFGNNYVMS